MRRAADDTNTIVRRGDEYPAPHTARAGHDPHRQDRSRRPATTHLPPNGVLPALRQACIK